MANSSVVLNATTAESDRLVANAVTTAGGFVQQRIPGEPIHFKIQNADGFANLIPLGTGETRVDVSVSSPKAVIVGWGALAVGGLFLAIAGTAGNGTALLVIIGLILIGVAAYKGVRGAVSQPPALLERIVASLRLPGQRPG